MMMNLIELIHDQHRLNIKQFFLFEIKIYPNVIFCTHSFRTKSLIQSANNFQQLKLKSKLMEILFLEISIGHLIFLQ